MSANGKRPRARADLGVDVSHFELVGTYAGHVLVSLGNRVKERLSVELAELHRAAKELGSPERLRVLVLTRTRLLLVLLNLAEALLLPVLGLDLTLLVDARRPRAVLRLRVDQVQLGGRVLLAVVHSFVDESTRLVNLVTHLLVLWLVAHARRHLVDRTRHASLLREKLHLFSRSDSFAFQPLALLSLGPISN